MVVMGLIPVGDSEFFFVPRSCHVDQSIFSLFITMLKIQVKIYTPVYDMDT